VCHEVLGLEAVQRLQWVEAQGLVYLLTLVRTTCCLADGRVGVIIVSIYSQGTGDSEASQSPSPLPSKVAMRVKSRGRGAGSGLTGMA